MKKYLLIIFFSSFIFQGSYAEDKTVEVWVRAKRGKLVKKNKVLSGLININFAETKNFKIVEADGVDPVKLSDTSLGKKAANVLYHMELAHNYFKNKLKSPILNAQTVVRIEMKATFLSEYHWGHSKFSTNFNNAETIPPSDQFRSPGVLAWNTEVWFRPLKTEKRKSDSEKLGNIMDGKNYKSNVRSNYIERSATNLANQFVSGQTAYAEYELGFLVSMLAFVEVFPKALKLIGKVSKKKIHLDTAMVPEIIYHEFAHVALYDYLSFNEKTPVVEGMANFFAAKMIKSFKLGAKLGKFGKGLGSYTGKSKRNYDYVNEIKKNSHSSFVLSMLWGMSEEIEEFDLLLFKARKFLTKDSNIKYDLVNALGKVIEEDYKNNKVMKLKFLRLLNKYGV